MELALWDIKAKALGVPVYELFGGPMRDRMRLYWSHCGTTRARLRPRAGHAAAAHLRRHHRTGQGSRGRGLHRAEDEHGDPGRPRHACTSPASRAASTPPTARPRVEILGAIERLIGTFRDAVGPEGRALPRPQLQLPHRGRAAGGQAARALRHAVGRVRQLGSAGAAADQAVDVHAARLVREPGDDAAVPAVPRTARGGRRDHRRARGTASRQAVQIGRMAEAYEINIAPHNYYSHLADLHSLHLCAVLPNVRIMEIDIDDVAWKKDLVTRAAADQRRPHLAPDAPRLGRRHQRGGAARAPVAGQGWQRRADVLRDGCRANGAPHLAIDWSERDYTRSV